MWIQTCITLILAFLKSSNNIVWGFIRVSLHFLASPLVYINNVITTYRAKI